MIPASDRIQIARALGPDTLRVAERIFDELQRTGRAASEDRRELLRELHRSAGDAMESAPGQAIQLGRSESYRSWRKS